MDSDPAENDSMPEAPYISPDVSEFWATPSDFAIGERIHSGEVCDVYRAKDLRQNPPRPVAIKIGQGSEVFGSLHFRRSTGALCEYRFPAVMPLLSVVRPNDNDGKIMLVFPLMEHGTLADVLKSKRGGGTVPPGWGPTKKSIVIFGTAVAMAWRQYVVPSQFDLRPRHIFLNENLEPVIGGYGFYRRTKDLGRIGSHPSDDMYFTSPEVWLKPDMRR